MFLREWKFVAIMASNFTVTMTARHKKMTPTIVTKCQQLYKELEMKTSSVDVSVDVSGYDIDCLDILHKHIQNHTVESNIFKFILGSIFVNYQIDNPKLKDWSNVQIELYKIPLLVESTLLLSTHSNNRNTFAKFKASMTNFKHYFITLSICPLLVLHTDASEVIEINRRLIWYIMEEGLLPQFKNTVYNINHSPKGFILLYGSSVFCNYVEDKKKSAFFISQGLDETFFFPDSSRLINRQEEAIICHIEHQQEGFILKFVQVILNLNNDYCCCKKKNEFY